MIYSKLNNVRVEISNLKIKKSGYNKFSNYSYFQLDDYLKVVTELCDKHGILPCISFEQDIARMVVYDCEDGSTIEFTTPTAQAVVKGCNDVQNLGAMETYLRRYLYQTAFELAEHDASEAVTGKIYEEEDVKVSTPIVEQIHNDEPSKPSKFVKSPKTKIDITPIGKFSSKDAYSHILALCGNDTQACHELFKEAGAVSLKEIGINNYAYALDKLTKDRQGA